MFYVPLLPKPLFVAPRPPLTGHLLEDTIALGHVALLAHIGQLLRNPLKIIAKSSGLARIRVCGALDYVIDHARQRVWAEPAPLTRAERAAKQRSPWPHPCSQPLENIDLLNPLCKSAWLAYIAARPGWFGHAPASHHHSQQQLFAAHDEMAQALGQMLDKAWRQVRLDPAVVALQHQLATTLTLHIGPGLVGLAMRARMDTGKFWTQGI